MNNNWISINDKLPEDNQIVLAFNNYDDKIHYCIYERDMFYRYIETTKLDKVVISVCYKLVTHWQPLPEIPL